MTSAPLARRLDLRDAVVIGASSMIGAGVFAVFAPASRAAGPWLLAGLALAVVVALCNATSTAQLAATYPTSGGTYVYGREQLGPWWGYAAGWCFVVGKTASCAAMATTFAAYTVPGPWQRPVAVAAVVALTAVSWRGVTRTAGLARVILAVVLVAIAVALAGAWLGGAAGPLLAGGGATADGAPSAVGPLEVLQSAGLIFFALAGYARIATLGEEVREPRTTIPRAIVTTLVAVAALYAVVAVTLLSVLGPDLLARSGAPLADAVAAGSWDWAVPVVRVGAAAACLGALLALLAGVGRTTLAMARHGDLPRPLAAVHPRFRVPHRAEAAVAAVVVVAVSVADLRELIGFSSVGVLLYYAVANVSAFTQGADRRLYPRWVQVLGAVGCLTLALTLPAVSVVTGLAVLVVGLVYRLVRRRGRGAVAASTLDG
ncbi:amino acid/polyamine/organocation transporter (APC superfamily) [Georgenia soli]|uniref:Amino acid/polyamine/organocation transporter (APC superfamily) n=1 Tax=Georgenia soli TaxID=638953 RepID=A0A2A9EPH6_9MICO|nr:APC family permease [Georgenia soli]PFG40818.1 amino acid/polyamine/organocation transporter (APC superfamily) [Georgenia soli]